MQSLSLVMSECFLSGRGQGHESHFYIVDLENFATFFVISFALYRRAIKRASFAVGTRRRVNSTR